LVICGCEGRPVSTDPPPVAQHARPAKAIDNQVQLEDVTAAAQVTFVYRNGAEAGECTILESLGGGVGLCDLDRNGHLDLFFPGGGSFGPGPQVQGKNPDLFLNYGQWQFAKVTAAAGLERQSPFYSHGCAMGDYDNDGFADVLVTGFGGVQLWHNQGDGTFQESSAASGIVDESWSSSAGWGDLNGDGSLDLYVVHYVDWSLANHPNCPGRQAGQRDICPPRHFNGLPDRILLSGGDGTFRDATGDLGLRLDGKGLGVVLADVDLDRDLDIYVANDTTDNFLYLNGGDGTLEEAGLIRGVARDDLGVANGSMGVDVCDFNRDGRPDLWVANYERESFGLYRNEGHAQFLHVSQATGITSLGGMFVGFGTAFADLDGDGDEDVLIANGHVIKYPRAAPVRQVPLLLLNEQGRFRQAVFGPADYFSTPHMGRGLAVGDLDGDRRPDAVFAHTNEPATLLANRTQNGNQHVVLRLAGRSSSRDAVGAVVVLHTSTGDLLRQVKGGGSYLSQSDLALHWGVPAGSSVRGATVSWPSGRQQELSEAEIAGSRLILEPSSDPVQGAGEP
jgi:hypothetical protein